MKNSALNLPFKTIQVVKKIHISLFSKHDINKKWT